MGSNHRLPITDPETLPTQHGVLEAGARVQHALAPALRPEPSPALAHGSCARCDAALPKTKTGKLKRGIRFCSDACRLANVRERRAAARVELQRAAVELRELARRIGQSLSTLGLLPTRKRGETNG